MPTLRFPDYGDDSDVAGARRGRKAFRLCVSSLLLLTFFMYLAERYLRHDHAESLYLSAITLQRDSSRVFLQSAIKVDAESNESATPKYTQALAVRQEDDVILDSYREAWLMDPTDSLFGTRYGCRLFLLGYPDEARDVFRLVAEMPPSNALPLYLEAAAVARSGRDVQAVRDAVVIISRANNAGQPIIFPKPFWYSGFPQSGTQYAKLTREIIDETCAPIYTLSQQVISTIERQVGQGQSQRARTWLHQLEQMGKNIVEQSEPSGTVQALAGIRIQQQAIQMREKLALAEGAEFDEELIETRVKLEQALTMLGDFENGRYARIESLQREVKSPIVMGVFTIFAFVILYLLAMLLHKIMRLRKNAWALPHSALGKWMFGFCGVSMFLVLQLLTALQSIPDGQTESTRMLITLWWAVLGVLGIFGIIYPALSLTSPDEVNRKSGRPEEMPETLLVARQAYRRVYTAMVVRYYGILAGLTTSTFCAWIILYRVVNRLYPWQTNLLADGLMTDETIVVARVIALFS